MSLPVLDVSTYTKGGPQEQERFGQDFLKSLQAHGFVKLANHGFDRGYIDQLMEWVCILTWKYLNKRPF